MYYILIYTNYSVVLTVCQVFYAIFREVLIKARCAFNQHFLFVSHKSLISHTI